MSAVAELGDKLAKLTIAEAVDLKNYLKEKYQIEPAAGFSGSMLRPSVCAQKGVPSRRSICHSAENGSPFAITA